MRAVSLVEVLVVTAMVGVVSAAGLSVLSEQVRRRRATDAAAHALQPHQVARDRAVGARTCSETFLVPPAGRPLALPAGVPPIVQRKNPMVAVVQWAKCGFSNSVIRVDLFELEGDIQLSTYQNATSGRLVFAEDGSITTQLPDLDRAPTNGGVCLPGGAGSSITSTTGDSGSASGSGGSCTPPLPPSAPAPDVTFSATTYFGEVRGFRVYSRVGSIEPL
ncbi:MAG: hypothetical protein FJ137_08135 [Deltaproteobacteria bacterium]|nr:hypothetical protein [Deltaproteobacteria bacterium]